MPEGKDPLVPTKLKVAPPSTAQVLCLYFLVLSSLKVEREDVCAHVVIRSVNHQISFTVYQNDIDV